MTVLATLPRKVYAAGTRNMPSFALPAAATRLQLSFDRNSWPDTGGDVISATFDYSFDGGQTWPLSQGPFTAAGGDLVFRGVPVTKTFWKFDAPDPGNANRRIRGTVTTTVALDTAVTFESI